MTYIQNVSASQGRKFLQYAQKGLIGPDDKKLFTYYRKRLVHEFGHQNDSKKIDFYVKAINTIRKRMIGALSKRA